jgi:hypothetical protein
LPASLQRLQFVSVVSPRSPRYLAAVCGDVWSRRRPAVKRQIDSGEDA